MAATRIPAVTCSTCASTMMSLHCQIVDALEMAPPPPARYLISDGHSNGLLDTRTPARRQAYLDYFAAHHRAVRELMQQCAVPLAQLATTDSVAHALRRVLANPGVETGVLPEAVA